MPAQIKPECICDEAGNDGRSDSQRHIKLLRCGKCAGSQQPGDCRKRQSHLFQKHRGEHERQAVIYEKLGGFAHRLGLLYLPPL